MKKTYQRPETFLTAVDHQYHLLEGSDVTTTRHDSGDPTGDGLPTDITNVSDATNQDPYGGHGHDGNTNRSKEAFDLWDDWGW